MINQNKKYLSIYLFILFLFSIIFLYSKHQVGNDSTISEWLINYEGGFTKRGITGQFAIELARFFDLNLRLIIFILQSLFSAIYFLLLNNFLKNLKNERLVILAIFTPIFILYPIAEIEVLARKEIIVFSLFLTHLIVPVKSKFKIFSLTIFLSLGILIWEPIIFFYPLILVHEIIIHNIKKLNQEFYKIILSFVPSLIIAYYIATNPISENDHKFMAQILKEEFAQNCYMSCQLLLSKSSIYQQFQGNFISYSTVVFIRYSIIIIFGFYPLVCIIINSSFNNKKNFLNFYFKDLKPEILLFSILPVIILFAMGVDWGRWVNITYVMLFLVYFNLLKNDYINLNHENLKSNILNKLNKKIFILFFIIYCFGWNPKTVITGDVGSFPGYRIPYKIFKIIF